jgi:RNA polymerase-associated protein LEO1
VTLAVGEEHYEVQKKALAPAPNKPYQEIQDSHYYAAAAHLSSNALLVVGHIGEQYSVRPNKAAQDTSLELLAARLRAGKSGAGDEGITIIRTTQDPELMRKQAELAEKERERARRRRENAAARLDAPASSKGGYGRSGGALSIGDLEGRRGPGAGRKRGPAGTPQKRRRRPEYDSDDDLPQGKGRQEDYDHEDDFIAPSDEEISAVEDEDEEELLDDDDEEEEERRPTRKRQRTEEAEDEDADADADADMDEAPVSQEPRRGHGRQRQRIVDDDDDE